ncbi:TetR/AcrR family transcriptional regulator [Nocardioides sp.]|uniref:TetR/AcrR family transcriptional regulator n=1 Tax=Nocardioides sp. TaxID=35761 RepID=UPI003D0F9E1A
MSEAQGVVPSRDAARARIVEAAVRLLREEGRRAVTTRAVAQAAGVQAPTIYRLFGDKDGLLEAVAEHVMATYVTAKSADAAHEGAGDLLEDLRAGWQQHLEFGLANPDLVGLLNAPVRHERSAAAAAGIEVLHQRVRRLAQAGMLQVDERRAVEMIHATGTGAVVALLATPVEERDPGLAEAMFEAVARVILTDTPASTAPGPIAAAVAFATVVPDLPALTEAERTLLAQWLDRSITGLRDES